MNGKRRYYRHVATIRRRVSLLAAIAGVVLVSLLSPAPASAKATPRPIGDFVGAQGTFCIPDGEGGCFLFVPPVANFLGQSDPAGRLAASVDYAGLADDALGGILGTSFRGTIVERPLRDGRCLVHVELHTQGALTWVIPFDPTDQETNQFGENPLIFGARVTDIIGGAVPSLGDSTLITEFTNTACGAPLPDLIQLLSAPEQGQELLTLKTVVTAEGFFVDGTPGRVHITNMGLFNTGFHGAVADGFPVEKLKLIPLPR